MYQEIIIQNKVVYTFYSEINVKEIYIFNHIKEIL